MNELFLLCPGSDVTSLLQEAGYKEDVHQQTHYTALVGYNSTCRPVITMTI